MPSTATKQKLKAFQFAEGVPKNPQWTQDKENQTSSVETRSAPSMPAAKTASALIATNAPPSTPENSLRLPLSQLLGVNTIKKPETQDDPGEELRWKNVPPRSSQAAATPGRKRKRAMSSSPPSASAGQPAGRGVPRTPRPDPAAEVWNRYRADGNNTQSAVRASQAGLETLLLQSSPHSSETAGSVSGLRRFNSCGIAWPTSRKRPKLDAKPPLRLLQDDPAKRSKVGMILELQRLKDAEDESVEDGRAEEERAGETGIARGPSSALQFPIATNEAHQTEVLSPLQEKAAQQRSRPRDPISAPAVTPVQIEERNNAPEDKLEDNSSDYSDLEMEGDEIENLFQSTARSPQAQMRLKASSQKSKGPQSPARKGPSKSDADEFDAEFPDDAWNEADKIMYKMTQSGIEKAEAVQIGTQRCDTGTSINPIQLEATQDLVSDEFCGEVDLEAFAAAEAIMTQDQPARNGSGQRAAIQRYLVKNVQEGAFTDEYGRPQPEKVLLVEQERCTMLKNVILRQAWFDTRCTTGSFIHVVGTFSSHGQCVVDNNNNMIILHPDHLIASTVVADSLSCMRRAILQDRVKATGQASPPLLYGTLLHQLFQEAMRLNVWDITALEKILNEILPQHYETIIQIHLTLDQICDYLRPKLLEMSTWAERFVKRTPEQDSIVKGRQGQKWRMSINKLLDIEEHIWSPNYGLKGNLDATVQITIEQDSDDRKTLTVPLEVKTGKGQSEAHYGQTALYTLLASDRYDIDISDGVLYYLETSNTHRVQAVRHEVMALIMKRNELACYVRERLDLPPVLQNQALCRNCYAQQTCYLYHNLAEEGTGDAIDASKARGQTLREKFHDLVKNLRPLHQVFFKTWDHLITKEESEVTKFRRELWTMTSAEREKVNRCFGNLVIEPGSKAESSAMSKINRYQYSFIRPGAPSKFSFTESQITIGEPIVVSDEQGHFALANGYVTHVHRRRITVAVDRRLHDARKRRPGFHSQDNQTFSGIMEVDPASQKWTQSDEPAILYRLDKDEFSNGMATVRNNLLQIMNDEESRAFDLRSQIVEGRAPRFMTTSSDWALPTQSFEAEMNADQRAAIEKVMAAQDYALVLGMPGTGKTTTIAQIIRCLVAKGKTVLLTSYTHTAVDNILLKLRGAGFDVLRLGVLSKIHSQVQDFAILAAQPKETLEEVEESWQKPPVVATTCLGVNHAIFTQRTFDYCIVDEASQITLPVCLGPVRMAKKFILVGDHYQLPPLVQNKEAQEGGLDVSMFKLLSEQHQEAVTNLEHQYRMSADVMFLANELIYSNRLKCGNDQVANCKLELPQASDALRRHHHTVSSASASPTSLICRSWSSPTCLLSRIINPNNRVIFLNTDALGPLSAETAQGNRTTNALEALLVAQLTHLLLTAGLAATDLGIITFYRSQLALLRQQLKTASPAVELHTADKFQGRDKEAVIVSFVRSNSDANVGELLKDWRRINVAITRARSKLILIGSAKTLCNGGDVLKGLVTHCRRKNWMVELPRGVDTCHLWPEIVATQTDASGTARGVLSPARGLFPPARGSPLRADVQFGVGSPSKRTPLAEIEGNLQISPSARERQKMPGAVGRMSEKALNGRPIVRDVLNDIS